VQKKSKDLIYSNLRVCVKLLSFTKYKTKYKITNILLDLKRSCRRMYINKSPASRKSGISYLLRTFEKL